MGIKVWKFGGSFFKLDTMRAFKEFIRKETNSVDKILFVVSALEGITRLLRLIFEAKTEKLNEEFKDLVIQLSLGEFRKIHSELIFSLFNEEESKKVKSSFDATVGDLEYRLSSFRKGDNEDVFYASILKFGEFASSQIFYWYLDSIKASVNLFDARIFVKTNDEYKNAKILAIAPYLNEYMSNDCQFHVIQGFIGRSDTGEDAVLGFDGSDLSAAYFAGFLKDCGREVGLTFWKNVSGFYRKDPLLNPTEKIYRYKMKYSEYVELPTHPIRIDAVGYAIEKGITVGMMNFQTPNGIGAKICP